ncbi:MAG: gamma carbonic anhydrase family protein [Bacteroidota bacterium]
MNVLTFEGQSPRLDHSVFVAAGVHVIGNVQVGAESSLWFNCVLRGDINRITIGERTNIQDGCVLHVTHQYAVNVGSDVTVGHRAIVHGCTVEDACLIGMGAIVLDGARIGAQSLIAAGTVVLQNVVVPPGSLVAGVPGRVVRRLTDEEKVHIIQSATNYTAYARRYQ